MKNFIQTGKEITGLQVFKERPPSLMHRALKVVQGVVRPSGRLLPAEQGAIVRQGIAPQRPLESGAIPNVSRSSIIVTPEDIPYFFKCLFNFNLEEYCKKRNKYNKTARWNDTMCRSNLFLVGMSSQDIVKFADLLSTGRWHDHYRNYSITCKNLIIGITSKNPDFPINIGPRSKNAYGLNIQCERLNLIHSPPLRVMDTFCYPPREVPVSDTLKDDRGGTLRSFIMSHNSL